VYNISLTAVAGCFTRNPSGLLQIAEPTLHEIVTRVLLVCHKFIIQHSDFFLLQCGINMGGKRRNYLTGVKYSSI